ncbi:7338_t:CDS:2 [Acaulospora colombiana]|uniref:7338_t:CDS:1 n=1 Tax=Acaulospora colombiana TaxID=27376 RepID=A0ACA9K3H4_9GLOM|nr:7338_t:CDS:2 [Acaulospora colombiana]
MEPVDDSEAPSESLHTVPIYQLDASSSDSETDDPARIASTVGPMLQPGQPYRVPVIPPQRSYTAPLPRHERQPSELSMAAESIQTRPSVDEDLFAEESTSEEEETQTTRIDIPSGPVLVASPTPPYETRSTRDVPEIPERVGLSPTRLSEPRHELTRENVEKGIHQKSPEQLQVPKGYVPKEGVKTPEKQSFRDREREQRRSRDESYHHHRESSDLLPLTLVSGGGGGGLSFSTHYAFLSPPFGLVLSRIQILARVTWFSQLVIFNIVYACYKLSEGSSTSNGTTTTDGKNYASNLIGLVILPILFFILYVIFVTGWTYTDLRSKGFDPTFTVIYFSPLMFFALFFEEKKRVDASKFHEVNYGAKWWRIGTSSVRESIIMTIYCLFVVAFVISDLVGRALNQPNAQVSKVFDDFVPFLFILVVFILGFITSIWVVVEALVDGTMYGIGEGRKRLVGVAPNAFKAKR